MASGNWSMSKIVMASLPELITTDFISHAREKVPIIQKRFL